MDSMVPAGVEDSHLCSSKQENCLKTVRSMSSPTKKVRFFVFIVFEVTDRSNFCCPQIKALMLDITICRKLLEPE